MPTPRPNLTVTEGNAGLQIRNLRKSYKKRPVIRDVSMDLRRGEVVALLGPNGSGKTTCLRLIAGFEQPTAGAIRVFGESMVGVPPWRRPVNTVFQDYALFPHLNVLDNVAYGLMVAGRGRAERARAAEAALGLVKLSGYGARRPGQLSGGQRQRVALARALVMQPRVLLLDEPLGALDLKLREAMQEELKALQRQLGITFVFVTHDQGEALSMADRIAVFNHGRIEQVGTPDQIYNRPAAPFVADFVGSSNVLPPDLTLRLTGRAAHASLRPEALRLGAGGHQAVVQSTAFLGTATRVHLRMDGLDLTALVPRGKPVPAPGETVALTWSEADLHVMDGA